jgi:energy-coupling factor transport system permease protein
VPLINAERTTIMEAQRARGLRLQEGHLFSRVRKYVAIIGPMVLRSVDLAQMLATAMDARGFGARDQLTSILEIRMKAWDWVIVAFCILFVLVGLFLRIIGFGIVIRGYI